jgi:GntR family phosphonate transport system transcriptional regulator
MPGKHVLSVEVRAASEDDARRLEIGVGDPIAVLYSLSLADGTPVALAESRFPEARHPGLADALEAAASVTAALQSVGIEDYRRVSTRLTATNADAAQALHLKLREGAPLLLSESLSKDTHGHAVEHGRTWFASERITLTVTGEQNDGSA